MKTITRAAAGAFAMLGGTASAATLVGVTGTFYDSASPILGLADADAVVTAGGADATFDLTRIDFPAVSGSSLSGSTSLSAFLGANGTVTSGNGNLAIETSVFVFEGMIQLDGTENFFDVILDDGFRLEIGGQTIREDGSVAPPRNVRTANPLGAGLYTFRLTYFENGGGAEVRFATDLQTVENVAAVPVPAALPLMGGALLAGGIARRRARR